MLKRLLAIRNKIAWFWHYPSPIKQRLFITRDFIHMHRIKGITREEYYNYEFENRSTQFKYSFLGINEQTYYLNVLNPIKYYSLARNKYLTHKLLEDAGVRKAILYCYYQPAGVFNDADRIASNHDGVKRILKRQDVTQCVIKATESSHGENVLVVNKLVYHDNDVEMHLYNGECLLLSTLLTDSPLIFESVIKQSNQLSSFNESSINTIRFMTTLYPDGHAKIIAAFLKIGRAGRCVDNAGDGGNVDTSIDLASGMIQYAIKFDGWRHISDIDRHPDSGCQLNGITINDWERIKQEVIRFQQAFPYCKAVGWDIAITDNGPVVIEVNDFWDTTGQLFIRKGWRNEIRDCFLDWKRTDTDFATRRPTIKISPRHLQKIVSKA